ncbi:DUF4407 domain-containing protein [Streptomyces sp. NPDC020965]|uniref:DUF4407 domain-containing protein n=1 Tax=Streptomyces sp. NPDC020965 TaxID=3365105 RepID=UPI00378B9D87
MATRTGEPAATPDASPEPLPSPSATVGPASAGPPTVGPVTVGPAEPARGVGRRLRNQIGVSEPTLDWVPAERMAYARYGGIVIATALIGGVSFCLALDSLMAGAPLAVLLVAGGVWTGFVYLIDSWLVSSTHGKVSRRRVLALLPRLLLSLLLGLAIAEPLLFQVFHVEIEKELAVDRERETQNYYGELLRCNPVDGTPTVTVAGCGERQLGVKGSPVLLRDELAATNTQAKTLRVHIDGVDGLQAAKDATAADLCASNNWIRRGRGWDVTVSCERARRSATAYQQGNPVDADRRTLAALGTRSRALTQDLKTASDRYRTRVLAAAETRRAIKERELRSSGLLDRVGALGTVMAGSGYALFFGLLLHLLLLVMDSLPVLVKLMGGVTRYDRLLARRMESVERMHGVDRRLRETWHREEKEADLALERAGVTEEWEAREHELRKGRLEREAEARALVRTLARRLLAEGANPVPGPRG